MNKELRSALFDYLRIIPYPEEASSQHLSRMVYSATAHWMRHIVLDQVADEKYAPKSKVYILNRGREIINGFLDAFPECQEWFCSEEDEVPYTSFIRATRDRLVLTNELFENEEGQIELPKYSKRALSCDCERIIGLDTRGNNDESYVGLTRIVKSVTDTNYRYPFIKSIDYTESLFKGASYSICRDISGFEFFNPNAKAPMYQSWEKNTPKQMEVSLGRIQIINGINEYYLFKRMAAGQWWNARISEQVNEKKDVRRIMLGLRAIQNNSIYAVYSQYNEAVVVTFMCQLPLVDSLFLKTYCWPRNHYDDNLNYVVPAEIWPMIQSMCDALGITLKKGR